MCICICMCVCVWADNTVHVARSTAAACAVRKYLCSTRKIPKSLACTNTYSTVHAISSTAAIAKISKAKYHRICYATYVYTQKTNAVCAFTALCMQLETLLCEQQPKNNKWVARRICTYVFVCTCACVCVFVRAFVLLFVLSGISALATSRPRPCWLQQCQTMTTTATQGNPASSSSARATACARNQCCIHIFT